MSHQHARIDDALSSPLGSLAARVKTYDTFVLDGVGDLKPDLPTAPLLITVDAQPGDATTTATLTVDGPSIVSTIDTLGDFDFFKVDLVAGNYYDIGQYLVLAGPSGVPLSDAYLELYDDEGNLIVTADGGGPDTPSGLDALLTFQATYTGTYYINARAFDQDGTNGTTGDAVGDYEVFVKSVDPNDANVYIPRYSPDQPMHAIDWGSQFDRSSRNPDGDNGPRDNGAPDTGVTYNAQFDIYGKNVITYYFAQTGDVFIDEDPTTPGATDTMIAEGFQQWEKDAFRLALDQYEQVADIIYIEVATRAEADLKFVTYEGTPGAGASLLGRMSPPNEENEGQAEFNAGDVRWTEEGLAQGGFYFPTLLHEFGHGHGMAHPHDNGGRSSVMPGADGGTGGIGGGYGDFELSQQVFTIMSYNDGWQLSPYGTPRSGGITGLEVDHFGWMGTLAALDIAVIQDKYGVNEEWATGDDVYTLKDVNAAGTFYATIWDAGGTDEIRYDGAADANIDLRDATLQYEFGGGGWVSCATGIHGGFTIANSVTIENATGGSGDDTLRGNDVANVLKGHAGADVIEGGAGNDTVSHVDDVAGAFVQLAWEWARDGWGDEDRITGVENIDGSAHADVLIGWNGASTIQGGAGADWIEDVGDGADTLDGGAGDDVVWGGSGNDALTGGADNDALLGNAGDDTLDGGAGVDWIYGGEGADDIVGAGSDDVLFGEDGADGIAGNGGNDALLGAAGDDVLDGGDGDDWAYGDAGNDTLIGAAGNDVLAGEDGNDAITGGAGDDFVFGAYGDDIVNGGDGNDWVDGSFGNDVIIGGLGADSLHGGGGDRFVYNAVAESTESVTDVIGTFYRPGGDKIDVSAIDADGVGADSAFSFVTAFSNVAGQAVISFDGVNSTARFDVDGDGVGDMAIVVLGIELQASDFIA